MFKKIGILTALAIFTLPVYPSRVYADELESNVICEVRGAGTDGLDILRDLNGSAFGRLSNGDVVEPIGYVLNDQQDVISTNGVVREQVVVNRSSK